MRLLIENIGELHQIREECTRALRGEQMSEVPSLCNAWLLTEDGIIVDWGEMAAERPTAEKTIDAGGGHLLPAWCDSHTHIVYAAPREGEFTDRIRGLSYEEIAQKGGGILNSAAKLRETSEDALYKDASARIREIMRLGTGAVEIKSGYGLEKEAELKMLRVIRRLKAAFPLLVKSTFLGAHAFPDPWRKNHEGYIEDLIENMLPAVAEKELADYVDVFCDKGFFSPSQTDQILKAAAKYGLKPKIHANELDFSGGIQVGTRNNAVSVDHLEYTGDAEIAALLDSATIATLLPSTAFFLGLTYPPARQMLDAGIPIALASDYNPGSSPSGRMAFIISLACIKLRMTPAEALNAATINGAAAMEVLDKTGSITRGKSANLILTRPMPSLAFLPYAFGSDLIVRVFNKGEEV